MLIERYIEWAVSFLSPSARVQPKTIYKTFEFFGGNFTMCVCVLCWFFFSSVIQNELLIVIFFTQQRRH